MSGPFSACSAMTSNSACRVLTSTSSLSSTTCGGVRQDAREEFTRRKGGESTARQWRHQTAHRGLKGGVGRAGQGKARQAGAGRDGSGGGGQLAAGEGGKPGSALPPTSAPPTPPRPTPLPSQPSPSLLPHHPTCTSSGAHVKPHFVGKPAEERPPGKGSSNMTCTCTGRQAAAGRAGQADGQLACGQAWQQEVGSRTREAARGRGRSTGQGSGQQAWTGHSSKLHSSQPAACPPHLLPSEVDHSAL